jgi:hypothetical protein
MGAGLTPRFFGKGRNAPLRARAQGLNGRPPAPRSPHSDRTSFRCRRASTHLQLALDSLQFLAQVRRAQALRPIDKDTIDEHPMRLIEEVAACAGSGGWCLIRTFQEVGAASPLNAAVGPRSVDLRSGCGRDEKAARQGTVGRFRRRNGQLNFLTRRFGTSWWYLL